MTSKINYGETPEFQKDLKKLVKKFRSLEEDLELVKIAVIELCHVGAPNSQGILEKRDNKATFLIQGFCTQEVLVCKIKKFACRALKGRGSKSGIRVVYAFHCQSCQVNFIEIYFKGEKENEDRERIREYLKNC